MDAKTPSTAWANFTSSFRAFLLVASTGWALKGAHWLVAHGWLPNADVAQFTSYASGAIMAGATLVWAYFQNYRVAHKLVAVAATGDPKADVAAPSTQAAISAAIADPNSAIEAKS